MRLILILFLTAIFGMILAAATAPAPEQIPANVGGNELLILPGPIDNMTPKAPSLTLPQGFILTPNDNNRLDSIEYHNDQIRSIILREWQPTNIACPKCGKALERNTRVAYTSYPVCYGTRCPACGYTGTCN